MRPRTLATAILLAAATIGLALGFLTTQGNLLVDLHRSSRDCAAVGGCE